MSEGRAIKVFLGAMLYVIGAGIVNFYADAPRTAFIVHPSIELAISSLGIFFLSSFFWGRLSYLLMLLAGLWTGGLFEAHTLYTGLAILPMLVGLSGGTAMGEKAYEDLRGTGNLFESKERYFESALIALLLAIAIGLAAPGITADNLIQAAKPLLSPFGLG